MKLDFEALSERLKTLDRRHDLLNYIYSVQGGELARLDYPSAALALHVDRKTISRYIDQLGEIGVILFRGTELQINPDFIKA